MISKRGLAATLDLGGPSVAVILARSWRDIPLSIIACHFSFLHFGSLLDDILGYFSRKSEAVKYIWLPDTLYISVRAPSSSPPPQAHNKPSVTQPIQMPKAMSKGKKARSFSGCKCCKQAKRKCPEEHPQCSICAKLGLKCEVVTPAPSRPPLATLIACPLDLQLISV